MPPDYKPKEPPRNLLVEHHGKLWEVPEGRNYLRAMVEYARALYSIGEKPRDAVQLFQETMVLDQGDHLVSLLFLCSNRIIVYFLVISEQKKKS